MTKFILASAALLLSFSAPFTAHADPKYRLLEARQFARAQWLNDVTEDSQGPLAEPSAVASVGVFEQKLDHGSAVDIRTFKQRYWSASNLAKDKNSPVLLFICGEGICSGGSLQGPISAHARTVSGHLFALEHRYYGQTQPFSDLSTANLKYLSTEQALADLIAFKRAMQKQMGLTGPWIAVGGSYSGNLAAYLRSQYPQDFIGALASSAPVQPDANFSEYDRHVARTAGVSCTKAINEVVTGIESEIQTDVGFKTVRASFSADTVSRRDDFLYLLADTASAAIQYGMRSEFCVAVETYGRAGYIEMKKNVDNLFGNLADYSAEAAENITVAKHSGPLGMRQWFYQSCTEYGYWQNADAKESMRSKTINAAYHDELCNRLFGMKKIGSVDVLYKKFYEPLLDPATASRILYTSGSDDPWINLSIASANGNDVNADTEALVIAGAAHCDDLGGGSSAEVLAARARFQALIAGWLAL